MSDEYLTLKNEANDEYIVKRSRFIGHAKPVSTPDEATDFINEIRSKHREATHNVYAYILRENQIRRYSDDGEPQGTAGIPVLDVLVKEGLCDCALVITRYFGGVMLGAGGLVRAYSHSAKLAVDAAKIVKMDLCSVLKIECDYGFYGKLNTFINDIGGVIENSEFAENVTLVFSLSKSNVPSFCEQLFDLSLGKLKPDIMGERFSAVGS